MPTHLAFLRAINLGAKRKFPKDQIRASVEAAGFSDVATYINTGNVRFDTRMRSQERIERALEEAFAANRGFEVPTIVYSRADFAEVAAAGERLQSETHGDSRWARHYVWLLRTPLADDAAAQVRALSDERNRLVVQERAVHLLMREHVPGVTDPLRAERFLGLTTNRNYTVISALAQRWC